MHYVESGTGTPLVLLHAFPVDARMWEGVRTELEDRFRVLAPDQRGMGQSPPHESAVSESPSEGSPWPAEREPSPDAAAEDVLALLDELRLPSAYVAGCSMGGYVAMALARRAPERIEGLILADTKAEADSAEQRDNRLRVADRAEREGTAGWLAGDTLPGLLGRTTRHRRENVVERARTLVEQQPSAGVAWAQRAMAARPDSSGTLRAYEGPALVVVGDEDALSPPESARGTAALLPRGELVTLPEAGHLSPLETPRAFADAVRGWLDGSG
ncbi:Pimeloyl-ACP methyl ester carboxylesterase [Actinopolyspora xinjiangensis]|uniref:Pimeloyl-ACP methyl ester carboxylesterase n=1 Tax=Actinopolyspora xinjiangensis TaxID=405564 RepID=A0A1H0UPV5_9ACTN|nr:alpha/beta fold hydrolase [Actinopolyspora xinjiangensis]SDP68130.1 Pimeloyl-ACP methyl ester carboxylesterase [Actinopolyspora xinjiangensis]